MTKEELKEKVKEAIENALYTTGFTTIECSDYADIIMVYLKDIESDLNELLRETAEVQRLSDIEAARKWIEHPVLQGKSINFPLVTSPNTGDKK